MNQEHKIDAADAKTLSRAAEIARCYLDAPENSKEELLLEAALSACCGHLCDPGDIVEGVLIRLRMDEARAKKKEAQQ